MPLLYQINRTLPNKPIVSGGIASQDATYFYRKFNANSNLTVYGGSVFLEVLVVGGGGSGGLGWYGNSGGGGGGGAGAVVSTSFTAQPGTFPIVIGAGGAALSGSLGVSKNGESSSINTGAVTITAIGGGYGAYGNSSLPNGIGSGGSGGSGGGGGGEYSYTSGGGAVITPGQGFSGGQSPLAGINGLSYYVQQGGGGGGGAGGAGLNGNGASTGGAGYGGYGGAGGPGIQVWTTGNYIAGGGGGGSSATYNGSIFFNPVASGGLGGTGGGGRGYDGFTNTSAVGGTINTGSGGGGSGYAYNPNGSTTQWYPCSSYTYSGGSGVVWVRYLKSAVGG